IYPSMQYAVMGLDVLGYGPEHPLRREAQSQFDRLIVDDERGFFFQPCFSPVWDTAVAAFALGEMENPPEDALRRCADWLLANEIRREGDWSKKRPNAQPSGWAFEFRNEFYPDVDDTAMVLLALQRARASDPSKQRACLQRAIDWTLAMQCKDGGWAAFDVDNDWRVLSYVPFADHNAMLDPECADITARILELLGYENWNPNHSQIRRALEYIRKEQEADGSWYGRWGVNYIYGTWQVLRGLRAMNLDMNEPWLLRAKNWLESVQHEDGGWGERCNTYDHPVFKGRGPSTASQTAWAVMGLCVFDDPENPALKRGVEYLARTQNPDGSWTEHETTGTGFPKVFYLKYDMYRNAWPLLALASYKKLLQRANPQRDGEMKAVGDDVRSL
ncbi:MAG: squalene--hopene cyclase, partial [Limisphaerales bacterium]